MILSDEVANHWWQGTSQALGVGFIVGGLVDVLAISGHNQVMQTEEEKRRTDHEVQAARYRQRAEEILAKIPQGKVEETMRVLQDERLSLGERAAVLTRLDWRQRDALLRQLDPQQYEALWPLVYQTRT